MRGALLIPILAAFAFGGCTRAEIVSRDGGGARMDAAPGDGGASDAALDAGLPDAGPDTDAGCGYEEVDTRGEPPGCTLRRPPGRPACESGRPAGGDFVFAVHTLDIEVDVDVGFDQDGFCTDSISGPAQCQPDPMAPGHPVDRPEGIDNAFGTNFASNLSAVYFSGLMADLNTDINAAMAAGFGNVTVQLRGWNGQPDDQNVELVFVNTVCGTPSGSPAMCGIVPRPTPLDWTLEDNVFYPRTDAFLGGDPMNPIVVDPGAYVSNNQLVARLPDAAVLNLVTPNGTIELSLRDAVLVSSVSADGGGLVDGFISGKWPRISVEAAARALDVRADDDGGSGVPCDAMSLTIGFTARRATWGALMTGPGPTDRCPP